MIGSSVVHSLMTRDEKLTQKQHLKQAGLAIIEARIAATRKLMEDAQEAANGEEKSSAGDKYETSRAMGHLQKEMYGRQLAEHSKELAALHAVRVDDLQHTAGTGACIQCEKFTLFIAAGLGKQNMDGKLIIYLSPQAPLARQLQNKKAGDHFVFNSLNTIIVEVY